MTNKQADTIYAFFDVDDTLISIKSMFSFQNYWFQHYPDKQAEQYFSKDMARRNEKNISWEFLNKLYYSHFEGREVSVLEECGQQWFDELNQNSDDLFYNSIVSSLRWHQTHGHEVVFVSGSFHAVLNPIAKHLDVKHVLATTMEMENGRYTGAILPPQTIGEGKAEAIRQFLDKVNGNKKHCYAYGDDISDLPMLESVEHPRVIAGGRGLVEYAKKAGWVVLTPA